MQNERFSTYYKNQNIVPEDEWEAFLNALREHLPTTFRVAGSRQCVRFSVLHKYNLKFRRTANSLNSTIKDIHVPILSDVTFEDQKIPPPVQIPWCAYPFFWSTP